MYYSKKPSILMFVLLAIFGCKIEPKNDSNENKRNYEDSGIIIETKFKFKTKNGKLLDIDSLTNANEENFDEEQWKKDAEIYLNAKEGETIRVNPRKYKTQKVNKPKEETQSIISHPNYDFEYSEYWRKEAYKITKKYLIDKISQSKYKCVVISQSVYQPYLVKYMGGQEYLVRVHCSYDCNQNYINNVNFWVEARYLKDNLWDLNVINQRFSE